MHVRPSLPAEIWRMVVWLASIVDPPMSNIEKGRVTKPGWQGLQLVCHYLQDIVLEYPAVWAKTLTCVPFPKAMERAVALSKGVPLTFELSHSVPRLAISEGFMVVGMDVMSWLESHPAVAEQLGELRLIADCDNFPTFAGIYNIDEYRDLHSFKWSNLKSATLVNLSSLKCMRSARLRLLDMRLDINRDNYNRDDYEEGVVGQLSKSIGVVGDCGTFRVGVWTEENPSEFSLRIEAWRTPLQGDNGLPPPNLDLKLAVDLNGTPENYASLLARLLKSLGARNIPEVIYLDLVHLAARPGWDPAARKDACANPDAAQMRASAIKDALEGENICFAFRTLSYERGPVPERDEAV
ncbi:hypothetical protein PENSPDRAFT_691410 [Peniophora sp. CONT]|nr:hypothetical protein PENSPDRAFT_691410 [Peniophora sp. CONT]